MEDAVSWRENAARGTGRTRKGAKQKKSQTVSNAALDRAVITIREAFKSDGRAFAYVTLANTSDGITGFSKQGRSTKLVGDDDVNLREFPL